MPIRNEKGLAALRALSSGGSAGLNSYNQAQANEAASRTTALQNALGGTDVAAAAQKAQATYAPKVSGRGMGIDNLDVAANSYLSNAANKLAAQNYEGQQNLALQAEALRRKQTEISDKDKQYMLAGAADAMAAQQRGDLEGNQVLAPQLGNLAERRDATRAELAAYDQSVANPTALAAASGNETLASERDPEYRNEILRRMAGLDQQYEAAARQYAGFLGTDAQGLLDAYHQGNADVVRGNVGSDNMIGALQGALETGRSRIDVGEQARLRELAPAFGINPLVAAGMYREGEGQELGRVKQREAEQDYVAGSAVNQRTAKLGEALQIEDADVFGKALARTGVSDDEAINLLSGETGDIVERAFIGAVNAPIDSEQYGEKGLVANLQSLAKELYPDDEAKQARFIQVADAYYGPKVRAVTGAGKAEEQE